MQCFLGCSSLLLYVLSAINGLITQRSVVQIHPPQPNSPFGFNGLSQSHNWLGDSNTQLPSPNFRISLRTVLRNPCEGLWLPKTPSELKMQRFRAFVRSWWYHDELSFCCPFRFGHLQFSIPCRPAGGDPRASSSTRGFPEECTAAFAPPALRPAFVGLAVTMVARLAPESTHRSPRYSDRLAP